MCPKCVSWCSICTNTVRPTQEQRVAASYALEVNRGSGSFAHLKQIGANSRKSKMKIEPV